MRNEYPRHALAFVVIAMCSLASHSPAYAQNPAEERLRGQLRQATLQMRTLQDQNATLQAMQTQTERERAELAEKLSASEKEAESLREQLRGSQATSEAANDRLKTQSAAYAKVDAQNRDTFAKLQAAYNDSVQQLRSRDGDLTRFTSTLAQTRGRVQACESKNFELYKLGNEILDVYDHQGLLQTLGRIEPFTKLKRVQYENLLQDYADKLRSNEIVHPLR